MTPPIVIQDQVQKMKIGIIIPDRGDRPQFLANCIRMMRDQTLRPTFVHIMDLPPQSDEVDITFRYRRAYENFANSGVMQKMDLIALIENDDWYSPEYMETMANRWNMHGRPEIFGTNYTIYYHLRLRKWYKMLHDDRASAMNTFLRPGVRITWPPDNEPYTDLHLWQGETKLHGLAIDPGKIISIGMKHGIGLCGGRSHIDDGRPFYKSMAEKYKNEDGGLLANTLDPESLKFYNSITEQLQK